MNQPAPHGSATILPFRARPAAPIVMRGRPAEIAHLRAPLARPETSYAPIVDFDAWYHDEAVHDDEYGKH